MVSPRYWRRGSLTTILPSHINQSNSHWSQIQLVQKQGTCLLQTWSAFSSVTARKWLGQDQQVLILFLNADNHICRVQRRGGAKGVSLWFFSFSSTTKQDEEADMCSESWGLFHEKNGLLWWLRKIFFPCRIMSSINYSEIILCSREWWAMGNDSPSLRNMPP